MTVFYIRNKFKPFNRQQRQEICRCQEYTDFNVNSEDDDDDYVGVSSYIFLIIMIFLSVFDSNQSISKSVGVVITSFKKNKQIFSMIVAWSFGLINRIHSYCYLCFFLYGIKFFHIEFTFSSMNRIKSFYFVFRDSLTMYYLIAPIIIFHNPIVTDNKFEMMTIWSIRSLLNDDDDLGRLSWNLDTIFFRYFNIRSTMNLELKMKKK